jgi:GT2 family glycosyltransferase
MEPRNNSILLATAYINKIEIIRDFIGHVGSLPVPEGWHLHLAIADNSGTWPDDLETPDFCLVVKPGANLGYLGGCRYALTKWREQHSQCPDFLGIVNNDITFHREFFVKLANLPVSEDIGIIAPDVLICQDGYRENPFMRSKPHPYQILRLRAIYSSRFTAAAYELAHLLKRRLIYYFKPFCSTNINTESMETIYAPTGSALFIRPVFFQRGGSLAYKGFLMGEEVFLAEEAVRLGLKVAWVPGLNITHDEHSSFNEIKFARRIKWLHDALDLIWEEYYKNKKTVA